METLIELERELYLVSELIKYQFRQKTDKKERSLK